MVCFYVSAVGAEADSDRIDLLLNELEGKDILEVIAAGKEKFASVPSGGGGGIVVSSGGGGGGPGLAPAPEEKKEEVKEEPKEESDDVSTLLNISLSMSSRSRTLYFK